MKLNKYGVLISENGTKDCPFAFDVQRRNSYSEYPDEVIRIHCGSWCALFTIEDERRPTFPDPGKLSDPGELTGRKVVTLCNGRRIACEVED